MPFLWYSSQNVLPGSYHEKIQGKPKLRGIPKSNRPVLFKNVIVMTKTTTVPDLRRLKRQQLKKYVMLESGQNCHKEHYWAIMDTSEQGLLLR